MHGVMSLIRPNSKRNQKYVNGVQRDLESKAPFEQTTSAKVAKYIADSIGSISERLRPTRYCLRDEIEILRSWEQENPAAMKENLDC